MGWGSEWQKDTQSALSRAEDVNPPSWGKWLGVLCSGYSIARHWRGPESCAPHTHTRIHPNSSLLVLKKKKSHRICLARDLVPLLWTMVGASWLYNNFKVRLIPGLPKAFLFTKLRGSPRSSSGELTLLWHSFSVHSTVLGLVIGSTVIQLISIPPFAVKVTWARVVPTVHTSKSAFSFRDPVLCSALCCQRKSKEVWQTFGLTT